MTIKFEKLLPEKSKHVLSANKTLSGRTENRKDRDSFLFPALLASEDGSPLLS